MRWKGQTTYRYGIVISGLQGQTVFPFGVFFLVAGSPWLMSLGCLVALQEVEGDSHGR
jgi:hypothetical protein